MFVVVAVAVVVVVVVVVVVCVCFPSLGLAGVRLFNAHVSWVLLTSMGWSFLSFFLKIYLLTLCICSCTDGCELSCSCWELIYFFFMICAFSCQSCLLWSTPLTLVGPPHSVPASLGPKIYLLLYISTL